MLRKSRRVTTVLYESSSRVATLTLNRPDVLNAMNASMHTALRDGLKQARDDADVRAVVLTGAGDKAFCTGIDRGEVPTDPDAYVYDPFTYEDPGLFIGPKAQRLWKPVIAAVNGIAGGGAFYLLGEVDIIARDGKMLVFVEVKTRKDSDPEPEEQVNHDKQRQITKCADFYLTRYSNIQPSVRFDVIAVIWPRNQDPIIRHITDAFEAAK